LALCHPSLFLYTIPAMTPDEHSAIAACQAGDLQRFTELYQAYLDPIFGYLYRRTLHRETAEDLTSTVFLRALEKISSFDPGRGPFRAWLYGIAKNALTDHLRSAKQTVDIDTVLDLAGDDDSCAHAKLAVDAERLRSALAALDPMKREIVLLRIWEDLPYREIAAIVGKSEGNCKVLFSRALDALRSECGGAIALLFLFPFLR